MGYDNCHFMMLGRLLAVCFYFLHDSIFYNYITPKL